MLREIAAVLAGYIAMSVIVMVGSVLLAALLMPGGIAALRAADGSRPTPSPRYLAANIVLSLLAAIAGGTVAARIARPGEVGALAGLCALILVMGVVSARASGGRSQSRWYQYMIPLVGAAGVAASGVIA